MMRFFVRMLLPALLLTLVACQAEERDSPENNACTSSHFFEIGDLEGHPDPIGAKAASEARAGRITDASLIVQPEDRRSQVRVGDYLLLNDTIAVYIDNGRPSDGYVPFGGEILAVDRVGDDGLPMGLSYYNETLLGFSNEMLRPESVTVLSDGSDGGEAVIRVVGRLEPLFFIEDSFGALFPRKYRLPVALDYVLEPGSPKLLIRLTMVNDTEEALDFALDELHAFFQYARSQLATPEFGYASPKGLVERAEFDSGDWGFAWRSPAGPLYAGVEQSGFAMFNGGGFTVEPCQVIQRDHVEVIAGGPQLDGIRAAIRRVEGDTTWREVRGTVLDGSGDPVPDAWVIELDGDGSLLSRTKTDALGTFLIHAPPRDVKLVAQRQGFPTQEGVTLSEGATDVTLSFSPHGYIRVAVSEPEEPRPLPVRILVLPETRPEPRPSSWGIVEERYGRLHQHFALAGEATLPVPPGTHRVVVSRGFEYEILEQSVSVSAGETVDVMGELVRSVNTTGWMCSDFHVHTYYSADSKDPLDLKVAAAAAEGLDIMTVSDHEWVTDPAPMVQSLELTPWMSGLPSLELTTFSWGHFNVLPIMARPDEINNGAVDWIGKTPAEVFDMVDELPEKPVIMVNHPRYSGLGGYFNATSYNRETGNGRADLWSDNFDVIEVCNGSSFEDNRKDSVADWFSFLERGRNIWAAGTSDNHHLVRGPIGYPRTCLFFGHDDPSKADPLTVRDILLEGKALVSGGIFVTVEGPNGELPGESFQAAGASVTFTVSVQAPSWISVTTLETIVNGETIATDELLPIGNGIGQAFLQTIEVPVDSSRARSWVVFHAKGEGKLDPVHPNETPFGHTNPIFFSP